MGKTVKHAITQKKGAKKADKVAPAPLAAPAQKVKKNYLFEKSARNFRIGGDILPKGDLTRFTKWPKYIRLQRQKRILIQRIKVPPAVAQFQHTLDKAQFIQLARLCKSISPETRVEKKQRLVELAKAKVAGKELKTACPPTLKYGINHVATLVEQKKAKLVIISHDVDPVEIVCWLPALCRKMDVPYCIVKSKSRLGQLVHKKTCSAAAIVTVPQSEVKNLESLAESCHAAFNENKEVNRKWGGGIMGNKSQHIIRRARQLLEAEQAKKLGLV